MADPTERFWEDLLLFIEEGKVVPVIGSELVTVAEGDGRVPLERWLAARLAARLALPADAASGASPLDAVVSAHLRRGEERDDLYARLLQLLREAPVEPAPALAALARIAPLRLFVSLTFDGHLAAALAAAGRAAKTLAYSPNALRDLPAAYEDLAEPVVFQLLGRASSTPDYAICDDDLLEFLHALQDGQRRPVKLFDALRANHLLILGCGYGDWLARFFLRTARGLELSQRRKRWDVLADAHAAHDDALAVFLSSYSSDTKVVPMGAAAFVDRLAERWRAAHPEVPAAGTPEAPAPREPAGPRDGAVFVSYAGENRAAAQRLADDLVQAGLDVWFDRQALQAAAAWALDIERGIERCALFLPVISREALAEENQRRYFWREWNAADDRSRGMAPDEEFIVPVVIDDTRIDRSTLPQGFRRKQGVVLPGGALTPEVAARLTELVRNFHRRRRR